MLDSVCSVLPIFSSTSIFSSDTSQIFDFLELLREDLGGVFVSIGSEESLFLLSFTSTSCVSTDVIDLLLLLRLFAGLPKSSSDDTDCSVNEFIITDLLKLRLGLFTDWDGVAIMFFSTSGTSLSEFVSVSLTVGSTDALVRLLDLAGVRTEVSFSLELSMVEPTDLLLLLVFTGETISFSSEKIISCFNVEL